MSRLKAFAVAVAVVLAGVVVGTLALRWGARNAPAELDFASVTIESEAIRDNVYVLYAHGAGEFSASNITVHLGQGGVVLVDTQYQQIGEKNLAVLRALTNKPVVRIINTHFHVDHTSGNEFFRLNGASLSEGAEANGDVPVTAQRNVLERLRRPIAEGGRRREIWPTETYESAELPVRVDGELIRIIHQANAHTDGDSFVQFMSADVISAGDIYHSRRYPFIDRANGGSFNGELAALDALVELAARTGDVPGETLVVPGHGPVGNETDVAEYRNMLKRIGERVHAMVEMGMSVSQIVAAEPSAEYDARFGAATGFWRTGDFVAAVAAEMREARER